MLTRALMTRARVGGSGAGEARDPGRARSLTFALRMGASFENRVCVVPGCPQPANPNRLLTRAVRIRGTGSFTV